MKKRLRVAVALAALGAVLTVGSTAEGASPLPLECHVGGAITITGQEPATWSLVGSGRCEDGTPGGSRTVDVVGGGRSDNLGLCSGDATLTNLNLSVTVTLTNFGSVVPTTTVLAHKWVAAETTYPVVTPFLVKNNEPRTIGEGFLSHHVFADCTGSPAFTATFSFQR